MFEQIRALGYTGSYPRVVVWVRRWRERQTSEPRRAAFVPMSFELGDAFQFDWGCEYVFVAGLRRRLEVTRTKLAASRAFWLTAYPGQSHDQAMCSHYLFEPEFCNLASGWEKGLVEKNVQDRRRQVCAKRLSGAGRTWRP